jgi:ADP-heptose:LPS heptosyltransferase
LPASLRAQRHAGPGGTRLAEAAAGSAGRPSRLLHRPLVCIHAGAGNRLKQWPVASFVALINLLAETEDVRVVLVGAPDDEPMGREIEAAVPPGVILSLVGLATLVDLPTILRACALFVGNDSGPKHIAAALGVPTVGIHSANVDAGEWGPLGPRAVAIRRKMSCGPCYISKLEACPRNATCLTGIRPQNVYHVCRPLLRLATTWQESRNGTVAQPTSAGPATSSNSAAEGRLPIQLS